MYYVIYDGNCNLCVNFVQILEKVDQGHRFQFIPMQATEDLERLKITSQDCELGMILIQASAPERRWQGSDAAEEISRLLPMGRSLVDLYRWIPGLKPLGDRAYAQIRDHRYQLFGRRFSTYWSAYSACQTGQCAAIASDEHPSPIPNLRN
jgi:predicted DCC family thiol-disulfide oxidoreductase YuxK